LTRTLQLIGSPVLRRKADPVETSGASDFLDGLLRDMRRILAEKEGLGLAAPQAGESLRLFILDLDDMALKGHRVFVNPVLVLDGDEERIEEGCLSIPGVYEPVRRFRKVEISAADEEGKEFVLELEGLLARAVQHECDHLDGILFVDRLSPVRRRMLRSRLARIREGEAGVTAGG
jgi:peptide deformylase